MNDPMNDPGFVVLLAAAVAVGVAGQIFFAVATSALLKRRLFRWWVGVFCLALFVLAFVAGVPIVWALFLGSGGPSVSCDGTGDLSVFRQLRGNASTGTQLKARVSPMWYPGSTIAQAPAKQPPNEALRRRAAHAGLMIEWLGLSMGRSLTRRRPGWL